MKTKLYYAISVFILLIFIAATQIQGPVKKYTPPAPDYKPLQEQVVAYLARQPGTYGLYFIDLNSGREFGYNALTPFHAASTFKLAMNLYLYREVSRGNLDIEEKLTFLNRHREGGTGILQNNSPGEAYSIAQLAGYSIIYSDNVATNILLDRLDKNNVKDFMRSLGGQVVDDERNITCPYDLALYMHEILTFSRQPEGKLLLNNLFRTELKDRIPAPLPREIKVANKIGTWPPTNSYHDVAYIAHPRRPYILVITSKDTPGYGATLPVIHHISEMVYEYQNRAAQNQ
ncbi:serine hydrolase [Desulfoscipio geothermicus]|uniref:Beta-lactamase class A n=1 Tax=Desulfoscipio geothermicus DSM 3669 TaxID=1121426 RepID=A0A1I6D4M3_9FIRM|nr:serine hydrolase [Desulfoscipio geothermicus]SFR00434.1 beta-lactamase class A [Desulfoscipio geothermicus DSM 3669]